MNDAFNPTMKQRFSSCTVAAAIAAAMTLVSAPAMADSLSRLGDLSGSEFKDLSEAVGAAVSYKPILPSEPEGLTGFDIGVSMTSTAPSLKGAAALDKAGAGLALDDSVQTYRLDLHKGLPFGFDIGGFLANAPNLGMDVRGAELRYALLSGDFATPAIALRGAYTDVADSTYLSMTTRSLDISISKGFAMLTPYAGLGRVWVESDGKRGASNLSAEPTLNKIYGGINMNLGLPNLAFEMDRTGSASTWGLKMGVRW